MNEEKQKKSYTTLKNQLRVFLIAMSLIPMFTLDVINFVAFKADYKLDSTRIIMTVGIIFIVLIISEAITKKIASPIAEVEKALNKIKDGDFTETVKENEGYSREINSMIASLNTLVDNMSLLLRGLREASANVNDGSDSLFEIIKESSRVGE